MHNLEQSKNKEEILKIILFDGVCNFCNFWVNHVISLDRGRQFRFAALQSVYVKEHLQKESLVQLDEDTVILLDRNEIYIKSNAIIRVLMDLYPGGFLLYPLMWIPAGIRDGAYDWFARNRYRWFGKKSVCRIPTPEEKQYFLE